MGAETALNPTSSINLNLSWGDFAHACGGTLTRGSAMDRVSSISTDTRTAAPADVFWAIKGNRLDAHDFLDQASGAAGWVVARGSKLPPRLPGHIVEVADTLIGLHSLATYHRKRFDIPIAGITGSNGKTSTKEMLRAICGRRGPVCYTQGNLNNHIGLPLTLLQLNPSHRYGVLEMGASKPGDIIQLARIALPTVGILTNIGPAHIEFFGSIENVFKTKSELIDGMTKDSPVAINLDDRWLASLETHLGSRAITYGSSERAAVRWTQEKDGSLSLIIQRHRIHVGLAVRGKVHYMNAAAAAAGAVGMGLSAQDIAEGLKAYQPAPLRFEARRHVSGAALVIDAYNANPASMKAGIETFCESYAKEVKILALGDMKELGVDSGKFHAELGRWISKQDFKAVFLAGKDMAEAAKAIKGSKSKIEVHHAETYAGWLEDLKKMLNADTALYLKASRAMQFETLVDKL